MNHNEILYTFPKIHVNIEKRTKKVQEITGSWDANISLIKIRSRIIYNRTVLFTEFSHKIDGIFKNEFNFHGFKPCISFTVYSAEIYRIFA